MTGTNGDGAAAAFTSGGRAEALALDAADPLTGLRDRFLLPLASDGSPPIYLAGQSLGLQPRTVRAAVEAELDAWARLGVDAWFDPERPWFTLDDTLRAPMARIVGARPVEIGLMQQPDRRHPPAARPRSSGPSGAAARILADGPLFPSDRHALTSHLAGTRPRPGRPIWSSSGRAPARHHSGPTDLEAAIARARPGPRAGLPGRGQLRDRPGARHRAADGGRPCRRRARRLGPRPRRRQRRARAPRLGRRLRRVVHLQVPQRRSGRGRPRSSSTSATAVTGRCRGSPAGGGSIRTPVRHGRRRSCPAEGAAGWATSTSLDHRARPAARPRWRSSTRSGCRRSGRGRWR